MILTAFFIQLHGYEWNGEFGSDSSPRKTKPKKMTNRQLTNKSKTKRKSATDRKKMEEALRKSEEKLHLISSHLLTAQEAECKRILMELHDELGRALITLKLRLNSIQKILWKDHRPLQQECKYVKGSIEYYEQTEDQEDDRPGKIRHSQRVHLL